MSFKTTLYNYVEESDININSYKETNYFFYLSAYRNYLNDMLFSLPVFTNKEYFGDLNQLVGSLSFQIDTYLKTRLLRYVIEHERHILESFDLLKGESSEEREKYYIHTISNTKEWIQYIFEKYYRFEKIIELFTNNTLDYINKLFSDYINDKESLCELGVNRRKLLFDVQLFVGDTHQMGKFVSKVIFDDGFSLMYKPRPSENEKVLTELLQYLNGGRLKIELRVPSYIQIGDHSWTEFLSPDIKGKEVNLKDYFNNMGRVLCVLYKIGASDIIPDNIIVTDGIPVLIDLECVQNKRFVNPYKSLSSNYFDNSVITVGILPVWKYSSINERNTLSSVLFKFGQNTHLPYYNGESHEINAEFAKDFIDGFKEAYMNIKGMCLKPFLDKFDSNKQRFLIHDTIVYSYLQREMLLPEFLSGKLDVLDLIRNSIPVAFNTCKTKLSESIYGQLLNNDIPLFYITPKGHIIDGYNNFIMSIEDIRVNNNEIFEDDLKFQCKVIETSIEHALESLKPRSSCLRTEAFVGNPHADMGNNTYSRLCLKAAKMVTKEIYNQKIIIGDEINWVAKSTSRVDGRYQADVLDESLYSGTTGIAEMFANMYYTIRDNSYASIVKVIFTTLKNQFYREFDEMTSSVVHIEDSPALSYHHFPVCVIYLLCRNQHLLGHDNKIIEDIIHYISAKYLYKKCDCGYLGGLAGYLDLLIELKLNGFYDVQQSQLTEVYKKLISYEIEEGQYSLWPHHELNLGKESTLTLGGFSHGSSGIAYVLYKLYKLTGDNEIYIKFKKTLNHDRSFFDNKNKYWRDGRSGSFQQDMGAWCHGAGGIGLSRALLLREGYRDEIILDEIRLAASRLISTLGKNDCVCHGDLGNLEILKIIGESLDDVQIINIAHSGMSSLASKIINGNELIYGDGRHMPSYGLFLGRSGAAYQMLRFAKWETVPSILFLNFPKCELL